MEIEEDFLSSGEPASGRIMKKRRTGRPRSKGLTLVGVMINFFLKHLKT
jgi:hypothetical protein